MEIKYCDHSGTGNRLWYSINGVLYVLIKQHMLEMLKGKSRQIKKEEDFLYNYKLKLVNGTGAFLFRVKKKKKKKDEVEKMKMLCSIK